MSENESSSLEEQRSESETFKDYELAAVQDPCALCGKKTAVVSVRGVTEAGEEIVSEHDPMVCNRCLVDLRGDMATELEVRRQLGTLEAKVEGLSTRQWILYFAFTLSFGALTFLAGVMIAG